MKKYFVSVICSVVAGVMLLSSCTSESAQLKLAAKIANAQCPIKIDSNLTMTGCSYSDNTLIYTVKDRESPLLGTVSDMDIDLAKEVMIQELVDPDDEEAVELVDLLIKANADVVYVYVGERTHEKVTIEISSQELVAARK